MRDTPRDPAWDRVADPLPVGLALALGLPHASRVYRKLIPDGLLWAALGQDDHGYQLTVTHTYDGSVSRIVPGRLPTLGEVYAARVALFEAHPLMVLLLEPIDRRLLARWGARDLGASVGLPTTVLCVQTQIEAVTADLVTQAPAPPRYDPEPGFPEPLDSQPDDEEPADG